MVAHVPSASAQPGAVAAAQPSEAAVAAAGTVRVFEGQSTGHEPGEQPHGQQGAGAAAAAACLEQQGWRRLGVAASELRLDFTLPTGQSFRWRRTGQGHFTGVVGTRVVEVRQDQDPGASDGDVWWRVLARGPGPAAAPEHDAAVLLDYFNLGPGCPSLQQLGPQWAGACTHFAAVSPAFPGARMLRQDPVECLFQFICSQNNHISRIHGMVERLCSMYGTPLPLPLPPSPPADGGAVANVAQAGTAAAPTPARAPSPGGSSVAATGATGHLSTSPEPGSACAASSGQLDVESAAGSPASASAGSPSPVPATPAGTVAAAGTAPRPAGGGGRARSGRASRGSRARAGQEAAQQGSTDDAAEPLIPISAASAAAPSPSAAGPPASSTFYAFPTLEQLAAATEEELRAAGFGYRAKFIVGAVGMLRAHEGEGGGWRWLLSLRRVPAAEAVEALCVLPGIGPKVAACVALFSLDKHDVIPVDTHVWQLAIRHYVPHLRNKTLTPRLHGEVAAAFVRRFGPYAGWAHNTLFISELAAHRHLLPPKLQGGSGGDGGMAGAKRRGNGGRATESSGNGVEGEEEGEGGLSVSGSDVSASGETGKVGLGEEAKKKRARKPARRLVSEDVLLHGEALAGLPVQDEEAPGAGMRARRPRAKAKGAVAAAADMPVV